MKGSWTQAFAFLVLLLISCRDAETTFSACSSDEICQVSFIQTQLQVNSSLKERREAGKKSFSLAESARVASSKRTGQQEYFRYWFMLPAGVMIAICCQLAGIGGAALFSPLFMLIFPLLGPEYPLKSDAESIATSLLIQAFGFSSGLLGFAMRGLVDWRASLHFAKLAVPVAFAGALAAGQVASQETLLFGLYSALMFLITGYLLLIPNKKKMAVENAVMEAAKADSGQTVDAGREKRTLVSPDGQINCCYLAPEHNMTWLCATSVGAFMTGVLGVGIGETVVPQLIRGCRMPLPVAAGTSMLTVVATVATAALVQFCALARAANGDLLSIVPWPLMAWTLPGVVIGGQIAPCIANRGVLSDNQIETLAVTLFAVVGASFLTTLTLELI